MTTVFKLIIRFDYSLTYEVLDKKGTCFAILNRGNEQFWQAVGQGGEFTLIANFRTPNEYRHVSIEPNTFVVSWENYPGLELDKLHSSPEFRKFDEIFGSFQAHFGIDGLTRAGFRIFAFSEADPERRDHLLKAKRLLNGEQVKIIQDDLGNVNNIGWVFEGVGDDKLRYRLSCGPFSQDEPFKYYESLIVPNSARKENLPFYFTYDLDLFETMLSIKGTSLSRWARPKWVTASAIFDKTLRLLL
jgi:hypothetical protein